MTTASDLEQLLGDVLRLGTIAEVDPATATCRVETGEITTGPLPWLAPRAGGVAVWAVPSIGEQCLLLCPEGDTLAGLVLLGLFSDSFPAPSRDPDLVLVQFPDGATLSYHFGNHRLVATLPEGGHIRALAPAGVRIEADAGVTVVGTLSVSDNLQVGNGATGTFTTPTGQVVVVQDGIITGIS